MNKPREQWPRGRMAVPQADGMSREFWTGWFVGLAVTFAVAGVVFAIWSFVSNL